jgi:hypothetical protein
MAEFDRNAMLRLEMQRTRVETFKRFHRLGQERQRLLLKAAVILSAASGAVALLPFERAIRMGSVPLGRHRKRLRDDDCVWAVEAAAWRLPWRTMCIEKGIAVQRLLRRAGTDARLHYGARHHPETGKLEAHVWVTVDDQVVIGGDGAERFAEIGMFPS